MRDAILPAGGDTTRGGDAALPPPITPLQPGSVTARSAAGGEGMVCPGRLTCGADRHALGPGLQSHSLAQQRAHAVLHRLHVLARCKGKALLAGTHPCRSIGNVTLY